MIAPCEDLRPGATPGASSGIDLILNSGAGTGGARELSARIAEFFGQRSVQVRVHLVSGKDVDATASRVAAGDAEVVVAGGGDGTITTIARHLAGTDKTLGVLPLGTFNYFARNLGLPLELEPALEVLAAGRVTTVDVGEVNGRLFLNNASVGIYPAALAHRERTYRRFGRSQIVAYASAAFVLLKTPAFLNLAITADGRLLSRRTPLLFVGTNSYQMESFEIAGSECLASSRLTLYVTQPMGPFALTRLAARALLRGLHGVRAFETLCASDVQVGMRGPRARVAMDGELHVLETPLRFTIRRDALRVVVPRVETAA